MNHKFVRRSASNLTCALGRFNKKLVKDCRVISIHSILPVYGLNTGMYGVHQHTFACLHFICRNTLTE